MSERFLSHAYRDGQESAANWFTRYAFGVLSHHPRDETTDRIVAERVYEMLAAHAVGDFLNSGRSGVVAE